MSARFDQTTDPALRSWVAPDRAGDFPIQNLPYGAFRRDGATRLGVAIGDAILDLRAVAEAGLLGAAADASALFGGPTLNPFLERGRATWRVTRARISELLSDGNRELLDAGIAEGALVPRGGAEMRMPIAVADYVDFYSSREHATNLGKILRPGGEALLPNWRHLPVGYHGRSGTVVLDGTPVVRPSGQRLEPGGAVPGFGPTQMLDFELELSFVTGAGPNLGTPIPVEGAREHIFGIVLTNDWSARDIQAWEYQPLGPFLGKSFATSIAPWIVTLDALEPFRVAGPLQEPAPLPYLREDEPRGFDIELGVDLAVPENGEPGIFQQISRGNARGLYWSIAQQLAHLTSNGAAVRAGDLCASGTISGSEPGSYGSLIELSWRGAKPLALRGGAQRTFLEDGDTITLSGYCPASETRVRIGLGSVSGTIVPAAAT
jgi:fumarylacetoacetase